MDTKEFNTILSNIDNMNISDTKSYLLDNFDKIINLQLNNINRIISSYIDRLIYDNDINKNNYKKIKSFPYYEIIYKFIPYVSNHIQIKIILNISKCIHGLQILNKIPDFMNNLSNDNINEIIYVCSDSWTFPLFLYYLNFIKQRNIVINSNFVSNCFLNSDDRIYKYIVNNNNTLKYLQYEENLINDIICNIFSIDCIGKYTLKRLKYLHSLFPNLGEKHFNNIISNINNGDMNILNKIIKYYYYQPFTNRSISKLLSFVNTKENFNYFHSLLKTNTEKNKFVIGSLLLHGTAYNINIIDGFNDFDNLKDIIKENLELVLMGYHSLNKQININEFNKFINNIGFTNVSSCLIIHNSFYTRKHGVLFLLPFLVAQGGNGIHFNKLRYHISKFIKNVRIKKQIIHKLKLYPIVKEMKELNNKSLVFNRLRNNKKILFNTIPPYHLYPGQLNSLTDNYLLKEKADGVLVYTIPDDINPEYSFKNKIKAEFIEDLDLYLVFDIDEEATIEERHLLIHKMHPFGQKLIPIINNEDEMICEINIERSKLNDFLKKPYDNYRWYPKPAWKIMNIHNFIKPFIDIINMKPISNWIINDNKNSNIQNYIHNDGIILTPLNGDREIKIKPKSFYTIDLLYLNNKWLDRDGYQWDINIDKSLTPNNNTIWRCYYHYDNKMFEAREIRYDKTKPNTHEIVSTIIDLYNIEYTYEYPRIYNTKKDYNYLLWKKIIDDNNKILEMMLNKINATHNVLDCGCGSGRTIKYLNKFNKYIGVDIDINMLGYGINKYSNNININFMYCDLNKQWPKILTHSLTKFDFIICLSSIMHFMTDNFWNNLNTITYKSTKMLINVVEMEDQFRYEFDEYFIERKNNKIYYKFPIHNTTMEEDYVDIKDINNLISKYGWNIIETFKRDKSDKSDKSDNLTQYYRWYIIHKCV
jgi:SAM-dependent methyltransferase